MPVSAKLQIEQNIQALSVYDKVARRFCVDDQGKALVNRNFSAKDEVDFTCEQDQDDNFAGKIQITGKWRDGGKKREIDDYYRLVNVSNTIFVPRRMSIFEEIRSSSSFQELANKIVNLGVKE